MRLREGKRRKIGERKGSAAHISSLSLGVNDVVFHPAHDVILSASQDHTAIVWAAVGEGAKKSKRGREREERGERRGETRRRKEQRLEKEERRDIGNIEKRRKETQNRGRAFP
jgi:hypothetical protein